MSPLRMRARRRVRSSSALLLAIGALTGLALGAVLADRVGGLDQLLARGKSKKRGNERRDPNSDFELDDEHDHDDEHEDDAMFVSGRRDDDTDDDTDDDSESPYADDAGHGDAEESVAEEGYTANHSTPDDNTLEERVLEAFHNDPVLAERAIDIGAIGTGVIELTGWVQASWEIGHAVTLARGVPDVTTVVDRLAVRDGERRRDHSGRHYSGDVARDASVPESTLPRAD